MIALALPQLAVFARLTRGSMIEALHADHIRTARAYGLPPRVVVVTHAHARRRCCRSFPILRPPPRRF